MQRRTLNAMVKTVFTPLLLCFLLTAGLFSQGIGQVGHNPTNQKRVALVIGNNAYPKMPLKNAVNDARAVAQTLERLQFQVTLLVDVDLKSIEKSVVSFISNLEPGGVGLLYYSGHGIQIDGVNYLIPVDFAAQDEIDAKYESYSANRLLEKMESSGSRLNIVILDACRDNPFRATRSGSKGLAQMTSGEGTFIAFATAPGRTASDNPGSQNGLFTGYLLQALEIQGLKLDEVFNWVRKNVYDASNKNQLPWTSSSVIGDFYFVHKTAQTELEQVESQPVKVPQLPPEVSSDYADLKKLAEARQEWKSYQSDMGEAFDEVQRLENLAGLKPVERAQAWQRFLRDFAAENPFSDEDEQMREYGGSRLSYWQNQEETSESKDLTTRLQPVESPGPAPEAGGITYTEVRSFVNEYLSLVNRADVFDLLSVYADRVNYYGEGTVKKDFIRKDKHAYYRRWPEVYNSLDGEIISQDTDERDTKRVIFHISFDVYDPKRRVGIKGTAKNTLKIQKINGSLKIVDEKQKVLSRKKR